MKKNKIFLGIALFIFIATNVSVNFDIEDNLSSSLELFEIQAYADSETGFPTHTTQECGRCDLPGNDEKGAVYFCFTEYG